MDKSNYKNLETELCNAANDSTLYVRKTLNKYKKNYINSPIFQEVSLFEPMGFERMETSLTRTLGWLLDEHEKHNLKRNLLNSLFKMVKEKLVKENKLGNWSNFNQRVELKKYSVSCEHLISPKCKLDVFISSPNKSWAIIIEAKINAKERPGQLSDYYQAVEVQGYKKIIGIYLTTSDDTDGPKTDPNKLWVHIHYDDLAGLLLPLVDSDLNVHPIVRFYVTGLLRDICNWQVGSDVSALIKSGNCFELEQFCESYINEK